LLSFVQKSILAQLEVCPRAYEARLVEESVLWHEKQEMALSPESLVRQQSEFITSPFINIKERQLEFRAKQTNLHGLKVTNKLLKEYLDRLLELKLRYPNRSCFFYDILLHETKIYSDQIVCKLQ
jgi:hypothetical protein